jgi:ketosteroid isomerase-like protein
MKKMVFVVMLAAAVLASAQAQKKGTGEGSNGSSQALIDLENKWVDGLVKSDTATLDSIFADTYVDTDEHSQRSDKQGVLAVIKSGDLKLQSIQLSDMRVYDYGDAAVVTGSAEQKGNFKGQPLTAKVIFTDTFVRKNGKWRAVASHRSPA